MVGLVLERMGDRIAGDPARLIEAYLRDCLAAGASRDFARPVLAAMITTSGTKEPRDIDGLVGSTGLARWQVESTLADLEGQGLVRPLDAARTRWEVSHDFLARQIGILLGRLRTPWLRRAAPVALPAAALGWAAALFMLLVWWPGEQERRALAELSAMGVARITDYDASHPGEWLTVNNTNDFDDGALARLVEAHGRLRNLPTQFDLSDTGVSDLAPLAGVTALTTLYLRGTEVSDLAPLAGLTALTSLNLSGTGVSDLAALAGLTALSSLDLSTNRAYDLSPLAGLTALNSLNLSGTGVSDLAPLAGLTAMTSLELSGTGVSDLAALAGLTALSSLDLSTNRAYDLSPLAGLTALNSLNLSGTGVSDLAPLAGLTALTSLKLSAADVTDLAALAGLTALTSLDLYGTGVRDLAPLKGIAPSAIYGVSAEVLATLGR